LDYFYAGFWLMQRRHSRCIFIPRFALSDDRMFFRKAKAVHVSVMRLAHPTSWTNLSFYVYLGSTLVAILEVSHFSIPTKFEY
jgi:hypothetical protein